MRNSQVSPAALAVVCVVAVVLLGYFAYRSLAPPAPSVSYTPGVPPWQDPQLKGKVEVGRSANDWHPSGQTANK